MKYVYGLVDPRTREIRYIGQTNDLMRRYDQHLKSEATTFKGAWITKMREHDWNPFLILLGSAESQEEINRLESWWILFGRCQKWELTNSLRNIKYRPIDDGLEFLFSDELAPIYQEHQESLDNIVSALIENITNNEKAKWIRRAINALIGLVLIFCSIGMLYAVSLFSIQEYEKAAWFFSIHFMVPFMIFWERRMENRGFTSIFMRRISRAYCIAMGSAGIVIGLISFIELVKMFA